MATPRRPPARPDCSSPVAEQPPTTPERWPGEAEVRAQLVVQWQHPGWQVLRTDEPRWVRYVRIPAGYYAVHFRLSEPPLVAATLQLLGELIDARETQRRNAERWSVRTDLRRILPAARREQGATGSCGRPVRRERQIRDGEG